MGLMSHFVAPSLPAILMRRIVPPSGPCTQMVLPPTSNSTHAAGMITRPLIFDRDMSMTVLQAMIFVNEKFLMRIASEHKDAKTEDGGGVLKARY